MMMLEEDTLMIWKCVSATIKYVLICKTGKSPPGLKRRKERKPLKLGAHH